VAARAGSSDATELHQQGGSEQAEALRPYVGQWAEVLVAADTSQEVLSWLARHERRAEYGMFRVPASLAEVEGTGPA
jgi:hypothetical protein